jgi:hypothetical protein
MSKRPARPPPPLATQLGRVFGVTSKALNLNHAANPFDVSSVHESCNVFGEVLKGAGHEVRRSRGHRSGGLNHAG